MEVMDLLRPGKNVIGKRWPCELLLHEAQAERSRSQIISSIVPRPILSSIPAG